MRARFPPGVGGHPPRPCGAARRARLSRHPVHSVAGYADSVPASECSEALSISISPPLEICMAFTSDCGATQAESGEHGRGRGGTRRWEEEGRGAKGEGRREPRGLTGPLLASEDQGCVGALTSELDIILAT